MKVQSLRVAIVASTIAALVSTSISLATAEGPGAPPPPPPPAPMGPPPGAAPMGLPQVERQWVHLQAEHQPQVNLE